MSTENVNEDLDIDQTLEDMTVALNVSLEAFGRVSQNLGKKGMYRVINAGLAYPLKPNVTLLDDTEVQCYALLQDIMNAKYIIALIGQAKREIDIAKAE